MENDSEVQTRWIGTSSILYATAHRPWPLPARQWALTQTWHDMLFAHFRTEPAMLRRLVPQELTLDVYHDQAWLSITPYWIASQRPPGIPPIPRLSVLRQLNVRTYVTYRGKPGVYFFSLDASRLSTIWAARTFYRLPYWHAKIRWEGKKEIRFEARRLHGPKAAGGMPQFRAAYKPVSQPHMVRPGSLDEFLTERYGFYAWNRNKLYRADIHHLPWPLQEAEVQVESNTMAEPLGLQLPLRPDLAHYARLLKLLVWSPERLK